jgi:hypothetical protein
MLLEIHRENEQGDILTLRQELRVEWRGKTLVIPERFQSDGASVPRFLWDTITPAIEPRTLRAAIVHDYIYRNAPSGWTRLEADELFYDFMVEDGFPKFKAGVAYYGVRWFGGANFKERNV